MILLIQHDEEALMLPWHLPHTLKMYKVLHEVKILNSNW